MANQWYCAYRVILRQASIHHQGLVLVKKDLPDQGQGTLLHVTGDLGLGMEFQKRLNYNYARSRRFKSSELVGDVKASDIETLEAILRSITPPHDERVLFERREALEARDGRKLRDCVAWLDEAVSELRRRALLVNLTS